MALEIALRRYCDWFWDQTLPFWAARAQDRVGGFHENLDFSGVPNLAETRRVRVQWRQVHVFSTAARLKRLPAAGEIARHGYDRALEFAAPSGGEVGCAHLLNPDGSVKDGRRDLYDQAFFLLASLSHSRAFPESEGLRVAARVRAFLDRALASPSGGFAEDDLGTQPRRQNPHMHLFEAFLALHEATGAGRWRTDALRVFDLFVTRFLDPREEVLREFFAADLKSLDPDKGDVVEPGHMVEWVWLLDRAQSIAPAAGELKLKLYRRALEIGKDASGFLLNAVDLNIGSDGRRRLWPQLEYLKASLVIARDGDADAAVRADEMVERLFESYLKAPIAGLWIDEFDRSGEPAAASVPASILYHLLEAALEAETFLKHQNS